MEGSKITGIAFKAVVETQPLTVFLVASQPPQSEQPYSTIGPNAMEPNNHRLKPLIV
jgi:hypothetical protein